MASTRSETPTKLARLFQQGTRSALPHLQAVGIGSAMAKIQNNWFGEFIGKLSGEIEDGWVVPAVFNNLFGDVIDVVAYRNLVEYLRAKGDQDIRKGIAKVGVENVIGAICTYAFACLMVAEEINFASASKTASPKEIAEAEYQNAMLKTLISSIIFRWSRWMAALLLNYMVAPVGEEKPLEITALRKGFQLFLNAFGNAAMTEGVRQWLLVHGYKSAESQSFVLLGSFVVSMIMTMLSHIANSPVPFNAKAPAETKEVALPVVPSDIETPLLAETKENKGCFTRVKQSLSYYIPSLADVKVTAQAAGKAVKNLLPGEVASQIFAGGMSGGVKLIIAGTSLSAYFLEPCSAFQYAVSEFTCNLALEGSRELFYNGATGMRRLLSFFSCPRSAPAVEVRSEVAQPIQPAMVVEPIVEPKAEPKAESGQPSPRQFK